jgi:polyisoprenoid-binding protein YceI
VTIDISDEEYFKFVARENSPVYVYAKNTVTGEDELKSTHNTIRKAQQKAGNLALAAAFENSDIKIRYEKHEVVDVTINAQDITMKVEGYRVLLLARHQR